jgi:hypothetical protein
MRSAGPSSPRWHDEGCRRAHRLGKDVHVVVADREQTEAELVTPVPNAGRELQLIEEWLDRRALCLNPGDVATERSEAAAHVELIWLAVACEADGSERLKPVLAAERGGRRIAGHAIPWANATQRCRLAMTGLHEARGLAHLRMIG